MESELIRKYRSDERDFRALAGECMLQLPDGRAAMIVKGSRQVLKTTVEPTCEEQMAGPLADCLEGCESNGVGDMKNKHKDYGIECEHGSLKRQCLICELTEELRVMTEARDAAVVLLQEATVGADEVNEELSRLRAERDEAQDNLEATLKLLVARENQRRMEEQKKEKKKEESREEARRNRERRRAGELFV